MNDKIYRFEIFDAIIIGLLCGAVIGLIFAFKNAHILFSVLMIVLIIYTVMVIGGRLGSPYYLEKVMVSILLQHHGRMKLEKLESKYNSCSFGLIIERLENRGNINVVNGNVELNREQINKGIRNFIMMWKIQNIIK